MIKCFWKVILRSSCVKLHSIFLMAFFGLSPCLAAQGANVTSSQNPDPSADSAAKAAARKKKFEETKQRLEEKESILAAPEAAPEATLFVSPAIVGLLVGESHQFCVFDIEGKDLKADDWSLSNSHVADLTPEPVPTIVAKEHGTVTVRARVGGQHAEATVTVYDNERLAPGTVRWQLPKIPGYKTDKSVQAVPSANGPDIYCFEKNGAGETLIRAVLSDGRQLWMKRFSAKQAPSPLAATPPTPRK